MITAYAILAGATGFFSNSGLNNPSLDPLLMREARHWHADTRLEVTDTVEGLLLKPVQPQNKTALPQGLATIRSRIAYAGPTRSIEEMNEAVLQEAQRRGRR